MYPEKYKTLIDEQTWAFIDKTNSFYPADAVESSVPFQRDVYNRMCDAFSDAYAGNVTATDSIVQYRPDELALDSSFTAQDDAKTIGVPVRLYSTSKEQSETLVLYLHGGGFVVGDLESHDSVCADIAASTNLDVLAVGYRLLPEHHALAPYQDALAVLEHAAMRYRRIVLCGDSAGGNLCAALAHVERNYRANRNPDELTDTHAQQATITGQVLVYPGLGGELSAGSGQEHASAPMLTRNDVEYYDNLRGTRGSIDPRLAPLADSNFEKLPATLCISAECDPLSDDSEHYCKAINAAGGKARHIRERGLVHGYLRARNSVDSARNSFTTLCKALLEYS